MTQRVSLLRLLMLHYCSKLIIWIDTNFKLKVSKWRKNIMLSNTNMIIIRENSKSKWITYSSYLDLVMNTKCIGLELLNYTG